MEQMRWLELLSAIRLGSKKSSSELARSPFHKDYDRIIFSQSFRQLNRKTQVHPLTQHDGIHTRLTHSLEVSCIGRSLGMLAAEKIKDELPMWISPADVGAIIQAACLAHDIGNPPFGHAGEYAIREWFDDASHTDFLRDLSPEQEADVRQFEGNAQGLRLLTKIDYHPDDGGMRLTPLLDTIFSFFA
jgi:dGTPase